MSQRQLMVIILAILVAAFHADARQSSTNTDSRIDGIVVDARTRAPLARARLVLNNLAPGYSPRTTTSRQDGSFTFDRLPATGFPYFVRVEQDGYRLLEARLIREDAPSDTDVSFFRAASSSVNIEVEAGAKFHVELRITPASMIAGRVYDQDRRPTTNAVVELIQIAGQTVVTATDSEGKFQFDDVLPGEYLVQAAKAHPTIRTDARGGKSTIPVADPFAAAYYPGVSSRNLAARVAVSAGSVFNAADVVLPPSSSGRIAGRITNSLVFALDKDLQEAPPETYGQDDAGSYAFHLVPKDKPQGESAAIGPIPDYDDDAYAFELRNIPPGTYELFAVFQPNTGDGYKWQNYAGRSLVKVGEEELTDVGIQIEPNADVTGRIVVDSSLAGRELSFGRSFHPSLTSADSAPDALELDSRLQRLNFVEPDGTFRIPGGVPPGRYWMSFAEWRMPAGVYLDTVTVEGTETFGAPLNFTGGSTNRVELHLRGDGGSVQGTVSDRNRRRIANASVILVPLNNQREPGTHRFTATNAQGEFLLDGIRPESYVIFALHPKVEESTLRDKDFIAPFLTQGQKMDVRKNDKIRINLDAIDRP